MLQEIVGWLWTNEVSPQIAGFRGLADHSCAAVPVDPGHPSFSLKRTHYPHFRRPRRLRRIARRDDGHHAAALVALCSSWSV
jgi:hypothetical protein